jgi:hypothetical protein
MLATLRVAPRLPSPSLRAAAIASQIGTGKLVHQSNWKADFGQPAVMHFYSGPPMHLRSGVDTPPWQITLPLCYQAESMKGHTERPRTLSKSIGQSFRSV